MTRQSNPPPTELQIKNRPKTPPAPPTLGATRFVESYVERLERALAFISTADSGGEIFPCGPADTEYAEDGNTVVRHVGPWRFLNGSGNTFLAAVEDAMNKD